MADYRRSPYQRQSCCPQQEQTRMPARMSTPPMGSMARSSASMPCPETPASCPGTFAGKDPDRFPIAMCYVPWQKWSQPCELDRALMTGTIFPDLDRPFLGVRKGGCTR